MEELFLYTSTNNLFLFGCGKYGKKALDFYGANKIDGFIDNDEQKIGKMINGKKVISLIQYIKLFGKQGQVVVANLDVHSVITQLEENGILNYGVFPGLFYCDDVPESNNVAHGKWPDYLKKLCDYKGKRVLEIGSRVVTGSNYRNLFENADYIGFDYYEGPNVDIVGDAHKLSSYFDYKFDLIFSSAVFEHLAMPWIVAKEIMDLLNPGGYIFIETHYCYGSHERPWHFFQFSEKALEILFPEAAGIKCIEAGVSNPIIGAFSKKSSSYLYGKAVPGLYCHSEFLGKKIHSIKDFNWDKVDLMDLTGYNTYPSKELFV